MNPIIRLIYSHIENGDDPKNFFSAYPTDGTRHGVIVWLEDGREITHDLQPKDHQEFLDWFKAAEAWWGKKGWEDLRRID